MKINRFKYIIYILAVISFIFFFLMAFSPKLMEVPTLVFSIGTILLYFSYSVVVKNITKFEYLCDSIMFLTFNIIGFALDCFYSMLGLNALLIYLLNSVFCLLYLIAYLSSLRALFGKKTMPGEFLLDPLKNKISNTEIEKEFVKTLKKSN